MGIEDLLNIGKMKFLAVTSKQQPETSIAPDTNTSNEVSIHDEVNKNNKTDTKKTTNLTQADSKLLQDAQNEVKNNNIIDYNLYDTKEWQDVSYTSNTSLLGFFTGNKNYTYKTNDGSTIQVNNTNNVKVKKNAKTGEVVVIGANNAKIKTGDNSNLTLIETNAKKITTGKDATLNVQGAHSNIANVKATKGNQTITVSDGARVENIKTSKGDDVINVENNASVGKINSSKGDDKISIVNSSVTGKIITGKGDNTVDIKNSKIQNEIDISNGNDKLNVEEGTIDGNITAATKSDVNIKNSDVNSKLSFLSGESKLNIENSNFNENSKINLAVGDIDLSVNNSKIDGTIIASGYDNLTADFKNSSVKNIEGITESSDAVINQTNSSIQGIEDKNKQEYTLEDGTIIHANKGARIYKNLKTGETILDGLNNATVETKENAKDLNVVIKNSNIITYSGISGNLTCKNSTIQTIETKKDEDVTIDFEKSNVNYIYSNGNTKINANNSNIEIIHNNSKGNVEFDIKESKLDNIFGNNGNINGNILNSEINNIETKEGSINLKAEASTINNVKNEGKKGETIVDFNNVTLNKIVSSSISTIDLKDCTINDIKTSDLKDNITLDNTNVEGKIKTNDGKDNLKINESEIKKIISEGNTVILNSEIGKANLKGDVAIKASTIENLKNNDAYIENSIIEDDFTNQKDNIEAKLLLNDVKNKELNDFNDLEDNLKEQIISEMQGSIVTLEDEILNDTQNATGFIGNTSNLISNKKGELKAKKEALDNLLNGGSLEDMKDTYKLLTGRTLDENTILEKQEALEYINTVDDKDIAQVLVTLNYIGNSLDYELTSQDGLIKKGIANLNQNDFKLGIGTTKKEAQGYINTFKNDVAELTEKYNSKNLTKEEFLQEYKRITGNEFTENNVNSLMDNVRENDAFENNSKEKIKDYQDTQAKIFQVGEFVGVVAAGSVVTLATGGAAGPMVASVLGEMGQMGIALTATTASFVAKTAVELAERQTNASSQDDVTNEEILKSAALMYSGCIAGQFGNYMGELTGGLFENTTASFLIGKSADLLTDSALSLGFTAAITGSGEFTEEFQENLRGELIGLLQNKLTGVYLKTHPDINLKNEIYSQRKAMGSGLSEAEINTKLLEKYDINISKENLSSKEVDTLIMAKITNNDSDISKILNDEIKQEENIVENKSEKSFKEINKLTQDDFNAVQDNYGTYYKYKNSTQMSNFDSISSEFKAEDGLSTKPYAGDVYLRGTNDTPLGTSGVSDCAVICLYNSKTGTQAIYHAAPIKNDAVKTMKSNMLKIMPEGFDKAIMISGNNADTATTSKDLFAAAKQINKNASVDFKHTEETGLVEFISYKGDVYCKKLENQTATFQVQDQYEYENVIKNLKKEDIISAKEKNNSANDINIKTEINKPKEIYNEIQQKQFDELISKFEAQGSDKAKDIISVAKDAAQNENTLKRLEVAYNVLQKGELDAKLDTLAKEAANYLTSENKTRGVLNEIMNALGVELNEITPDKNGILHSSFGNNDVSARAKSADSIYSKLRNKMYSLKNDMPENVTDALELIHDAQGLRVNIENIKPTEDNIGDVKIKDSEKALFCKYLQDPNTKITPEQKQRFDSVTDDALKNIAESQSRNFVNSLCKGVKEGKIHITEVENYCGKDGIPYFSEDQLETIKESYEYWFNKTLNEVNENPRYTVKYDKNSPYLYDNQTGKKYMRTLTVCETIPKKNGYTAAQIGLIDELGQYVEFQYRGSEVDSLAKWEHIIYDVKKGKETVAGEKYADVRNVVKKINDNNLMEEYEQYFNDTFNAQRKIELGKECQIPEITDYENLVAILGKYDIKFASYKGVMEAHDKD